MKKAKKASKCLNPNCERTSSARGLCRSCYVVAMTAVRHKETTWKKLEATGKCLPSSHPTRMVPHGATIAWIRG